MTYREVKVKKGGQVFVFKCEAGREDELRDEIDCAALNANCPIDWLDATVLSLQITQLVAEECARTLSLDLDDMAAKRRMNEDRFRDA